MSAEPGAVPAEQPRSLAGGALLAALGRIAFVVGAAIATILVARILGPHGSGAFLVISSLMVTLLALSTLGMDFGVAWLVSARRWDLPGAMASTALASVILGIAGLAVGMLIHTLASKAFAGVDTGVALLALVSLPPALLVVIYFQLAIAAERYEAALALGVSQAVGYVIGVAVLAATLGLEGAVAGLLVGQVVGGIVALAWWRRTPRGPGEGGIDTAKLKEALLFGVKLYSANAAAILIYRFDVFLLNAYSGEAEAGYYAVAIAATTALGVLPAALGNVLFPRLASLSTNGSDSDSDKRREVQDQAIRHTMLIIVVTSALLAVALPVLTKPVFGDAFEPAIVPGLILIPGAAALGLATTLYSALAGRGRPDYAMKIALLTTPMAIALYFLLVPALEAEGAALGSDVAYITSAVLAAFALRRVSGPGGPGASAVIPGRQELRDYGVLFRQIRERLRAPKLGEAGDA